MKQKILFSMVICLLMLLPIAKAASVSPENDPVIDTTEISNEDITLLVWGPSAKLLTED